MKKIIGVVLVVLMLPALAFAQTKLIMILDEDSGFTRWTRAKMYIASLNYWGESALIRQSIQNSMTTIPNDPYYTSSGSWGQDYDDMWGLKRINIENAWKLSTGSGVTIAVIDTGVDYTHVDINDNIWYNQLELSGVTGTDDDGNGYIDDIRGWNFDENNNDVMDDHGHGTHVAGIAAAEGNNQEGIIGVSYEANIMSLKILDKWGVGYGSNPIVKAIEYAVDMGAKILSCSFGTTSYNTAIVNAFKYAYDHGCFIIAAAGNDNRNINIYPAKLDYAVAVGSIDESNNRSSFSNYGSLLDVMAPGRDILSLRSSDLNSYEWDSSYFVPEDDPSSLYLRASGTSMATPFVSGIAALMLSQDPSITVNDFMRRMKFSSVDLGAVGKDNYYGWGLIDAYEALSYDWYDSGIIKTHWLTDVDQHNSYRYDFYESGVLMRQWLLEPDSTGAIRYDFYESGAMLSRWLLEPDLDGMIRYDYSENGYIISKWLDVPNENNVIRYDYYESGRIKTAWLDAPDEDGNIKYTYFDESFVADLGRIYCTENESGNIKYIYSYVIDSDIVLSAYDPNFSAGLGGAEFFYFYSTDLSVKTAVNIEFDNGDLAEGTFLPTGELVVTKYIFDNGARTAWFLWDDVGGFLAYTVIEQVSQGDGFIWYKYKFNAQAGTDPVDYIIPSAWTDCETIDAPNESILPQNENWFDYCYGEWPLPEFPPLSSQFTLDIYNRITSRTDHNPAMDVVYRYAWDYPMPGLVTMTIFYDYNGDSSDEAVVTYTYRNGSDYDLKNRKNWLLASKIDYVNGVTYTYFESGLIESKTYDSADQYGNVYYYYKDEPFYTDEQGKPYGRLFKQVYANKQGYGEWACEYEYYEGTGLVHKKYCYAEADYSDASDPILSDLKVTYEYDRLGRMITKDPVGRYPETWEWDTPVQGQATRKMYYRRPDGEWVLARIWIFENGTDYNISNLFSWNCILERIIREGSTFYEYDELGRLIKITFDNTGDYVLISYWGDTSVMQKKESFSASGVRTEIIEYYENGVKRYREIPDPDPAQSGDQIRWEYTDDYMREKAIWDDGRYTITQLFDNEKAAYFEYDTSGNWVYSTGHYSYSPDENGFVFLCRIEYKAFKQPDTSGNVYYHYMDEEYFYNYGGYFGRIDGEVNDGIDSDGAVAYRFEYPHDSSWRSKKYCYAGVDLTDLFNPIYSDLILTYSYYLSYPSRLESKTYVNPDAFGNIYYYYIDEDFFSDPTTGARWGRLDKQVSAEADGDGAIGYSYEYAHSSSSKIYKKYCYGSADYSDPSNPTFDNFILSYAYDHLDRIIEKRFENGLMFTYDWGYKPSEYVTIEQWNDDVLCYSWRYDNNWDYDLSHMNEWRKIWETDHIAGITYTFYPESQRLSSKELNSPDENGNIYYHYIDEDYNGRGYGRIDKQRRQTPDGDGALSCRLEYFNEDANTAAGDFNANGIIDIVVDFGAEFGLWIYYDGYRWEQINMSSPESMQVLDRNGDGVDELLVDYGQYGIWSFDYAGGWSGLHSYDPKSIAHTDIDGDGKDDIIVDFGKDYGLWIYSDDGIWSQLHTLSTDSITSFDFMSGGKENAVVDFGQFGLWFYDDDNQWMQINSNDPDSMIAADIDGNGNDGLVIDFGQYGLWSYGDDNSWYQININDPESVTAGDLDGDGKTDLVIDFGAYGVHIYTDEGEWIRLHGLNPKTISTADLNGDGRDEIIIDFGILYGVWVYDAGTWQQLNSTSPFRGVKKYLYRNDDYTDLIRIYEYEDTEWPIQGYSFDTRQRDDEIGDMIQSRTELISRRQNGESFTYSNKLAGMPRDMLKRQK